MRRDDICIGAFVRLLSNWLDIPKGAVGTIDALETGEDGSWFFTIFWAPHRPLPQRTCRSAIHKTGFQSGSFGLPLWEEDLPRFEIISQEEKDAALFSLLQIHRRKFRKPSAVMLSHADQLPLPFGNSYQVVRGTFFLDSGAERSQAG